MLLAIIQNKSGLCYNCVLGISTQTCHCCRELNVNGAISTDPFVISSALNGYFCEVSHNLDLKFDDNIDFEQYWPIRDFKYFNYFEPATLPEIKDEIFKFDDLSSGCDEVLASVFKNFFDIVGNLIFLICNRSLAGGCFLRGLCWLWLFSCLKSVIRLS